jgi:pilus assembly protein CpaC
VTLRTPILLSCRLVLVFAVFSQPILQAQASAPAAPPQVPVPPPSQPESSNDVTNDLSVAVGKSALVDFTRPITRVAIGMAEIAEATAVSPQEVMIVGKAPGNTSLIVWQQGGGRQFFNVIVHPSRAAAEDNIASLRRELKLAMPSENINIASENNLVVLRGTVKDLTDSDRAVQIASTAGKVINLLYVDVPPSPQQILLKVRFASVDRSLERQLGINIFSTGAANTIGTVSTGQFSPPTVTVPNGTTGPVATLANALQIFLFRPDLNLGATIQALENQGLVEVLAEPNMLAQDGKQASFLAGGEYPYPVVQGTSGGSGTVSIQFKEFGIRLNFIPTITPRGTIRLQVAPEVSALDFANGVQISGFTVPGLDVRKVNTEVELGEGQSFAIGGLLDNRENKTFEKIPFIGSIPVLGKFFQSIQKTRNNTELIVIVTPEIVQPIDKGQPLPQLNYPDKFLPPNSKIPMNTPTGLAAAPAPTVPPMPVEKLIQSMQPEKQLVIEGSYSTGGYGTGAGAGAGMGVGMSPTPQQPQ